MLRLVLRVDVHVVRPVRPVELRGRAWPRGRRGGRCLGAAARRRSRARWPGARRTARAGRRAGRGALRAARGEEGGHAGDGSPREHAPAADRHGRECVACHRDLLHVPGSVRPSSAAASAASADASTTNDVVRRPGEVHLVAASPELGLRRPLDVLLVDHDPRPSPGLDDVLRADADVRGVGDRAGELVVARRDGVGHLAQADLLGPDPDVDGGTAGDQRGGNPDARVVGQLRQRRSRRRCRPPTRAAGC